MSSSANPDPPHGGSGPDPSMEDILASIRRILSEEEGDADAPQHSAPPPVADDVLLLDTSMMVPENGQQPEAPVVTSQPPEAEPPSHGSLMAPETAQAAAGAVGELVRRLAAERHTHINAGGPTIEDLVRAELRPLLKAWLDEHLAPMVERLVQAEIARVVGRAVP